MGDNKTMKETYSRKITTINMIWVLIIFSVIDIITTWIALHYGLGREGNCNAVSLFNNIGFWWSILIKCILTGLVILFMYLIRHWEQMFYTSLILNALYLNVIINNITVILFQKDFTILMMGC